MMSNKSWGFTNANGGDLCPWPKDNYEYIGINRQNPIKGRESGSRPEHEWKTGGYSDEFDELLFLLMDS